MWEGGSADDVDKDVDEGGMGEDMENEASPDEGNEESHDTQAQLLLVAPRVHDGEEEETNREDRIAMFMLEEIEIPAETAECKKVAKQENVSMAMNRNNGLEALDDRRNGDRSGYDRVGNENIRDIKKPNVVTEKACSGGEV